MENPKKLVSKMIKQKGKQIHQEQCCLSRNSFITKIFGILDFENEVHFWHE